MFLVSSFGSGMFGLERIDFFGKVSFRASSDVSERVAARISISLSERVIFDAMLKALDMFGLHSMWFL